MGVTFAALRKALGQAPPRAYRELVGAGDAPQVALALIEWYPLAEVGALDEDDFRPGLVAVGHDPAGDQLCWYPRWRPGSGGRSEIPLVWVDHEIGEGRLYALTFGDALYRLLLEELASVLSGDVPAALARVQPWITTEQHATLAAITARAPRRGGARLAQAELERLVAALGLPPKPWLQCTHLPTVLGVPDADALPAYEGSVAYWRELLAEGHAHFADRLATTLMNLGLLLRRLGRRGAAAPLGEAADLYEAVAAGGDWSVFEPLAMCHWHLGQLGAGTKSRAHYERALTLYAWLARERGARAG